MGGGASVSAEKKQNEEIARQLREAEKEEDRKIKILLLGTGNSGKSTILKQFQIMHKSEGLGDLSKKKRTVSSNILSGILQLAEEAQSMEGLTKSVNPVNSALVTSLGAREVRRARDIWEPHPGTEQSGRIIDTIKVVLEDECLQEILQSRILDLKKVEIPVEFFLAKENFERYLSDDFVPTQEDIIKCRVRTTGVVSVDFMIDGNPCVILDVGGQRNERKKWISHFDNCTALMFLVSLAEYDTFLLEDESQNRMHEALKVFEDIVRGPYFEKVNLILFLNKKDLFEEKLKHKDIRIAFPEYDGPNEYEKVLQFVKGKFINLFRDIRGASGIQSSQSDVYAFETMATNTENVKTVFGLCKHIIFKGVMADSGFL